MNKANAKKLGYVGKVAGRDSSSWFTPPNYIEAARKALCGSIELDPFTSDKANETVKAKYIFTKENSAFVNEWPKVKTCFMNPPYGAGLCGKAIDRFLDQYEKGKFKRGIILVNNATDTKWFQRAVEKCSAFCMTDHRIGFYNADGKAVSTNTRGQIFLYYGKTSFPTFRKHISQFGFVCKVV